MKKTIITILILAAIAVIIYIFITGRRAPEDDQPETPLPTSDELPTPPANTETPTEEPQPPATSGDNPLPGSVVHDVPTPPLIDAIKKDLALVLSIPEEEILVLSSVERDWPDACLGLAGDDEICAQVITPGFEVTLRAQGVEYRYRTNADGSAFRKDPYNYY